MSWYDAKSLTENVIAVQWVLNSSKPVIVERSVRPVRSSGPSVQGKTIYFSSKEVHLCCRGQQKHFENIDIRFDSKTCISDSSVSELEAKS